MLSAFKVDISQPCNRHWENMEPSGSGRYCQSCQKNVVDFSVMSDKEIFQFINNAYPVCGRFANDQLNRKYDPGPRQKSVYYWKHIWQLLIAGTLFTNPARSQVKHTEPISINDPLYTGNSNALDILIKSLDNNTYLLIDGTTKQPLIQATVNIDSINHTTDNNGRFRLNAFSKKVSISHVGYETKEILLGTEPLPRCITLVRNMDVLDEVSVTGYSSPTSCRYSMGGVSSVHVISIFDKFVRNVNQLIPDQAVKVFPNPVIGGQPLNIQLSIPKPGKYALKLFSTDGRLVYAQSLQITSQKQQLQLPTFSLYSSGVYWLQIKSASEKQKNYEVKVVVR